MLSILETCFDSYVCLSCVTAAAQQSINEAVHLRLETSVDLSKLATSDGVIASARLTDTVNALEELTSGWCQQIEQVSMSYFFTKSSVLTAHGCVP